MQALVLREKGGQPELAEFDEPTSGDGCSIVRVSSAGLNPVDRIFAGMDGLPLPRAVGTEGVGTLEDGRRVYFNRTKAPFGAVAGRALVPDASLIELPEGISDEQALVIGISGLAGWMPLAEAAGLKPGETVLVLGATGAQGQIAVQAAKLLGAGRVVAAGRDRETLEMLKDRGADDAIVLEDDMVAAFKDAAIGSVFDVVIDSLYGKPHEALLDSGVLGASSRVVVVGASAGSSCDVSFSRLQALHGATIAGYGNNEYPAETVQKHYLAMAKHIVNGKLQLDTESLPFERAADAWAEQASGPHHKVVVSVTR